MATAFLRSIPIALSAIALTFGGGCRARQAPTSGLEATEEDLLLKAQYDDTAPRDGRNWTQQRVLNLNQYARHLLHLADQQLISEWKKHGVNNPQPMTSYEVFLKKSDALPGEPRQGACFYEYGYLSISRDKDIYHDAHLHAVRQQVEHAIIFAMRQHQLLLGTRQLTDTMEMPLSFHTIEICTVSTMQQIMAYDPGLHVLRIGIVNSGDSYIISTADELQKMWNMGVQFTDLKSKLAISNNTLVKLAKSVVTKVQGTGAQQKIWEIANPIGQYRVVIRQLLHASGIDLKDRLRRLYQANKAKPSALAAAIDAEFLGANTGDLVDKSLLSTSLGSVNWQKDLTKLDAAQMRQLLGRWAFQASEPKQRLAAEVSAMRAIATKTKSSKVNIETTIRAAVAVGNAHVIEVDANLFPPMGLEEFAQAEISTEVNIKSDIRAGVAVFTNDVILVQANIGPMLGTAGLARSLLSIFKGYDPGGEISLD